MKIVIAPDSYKGNLTAVEVADLIECGIKKADPGILTVKIPVADGGEGTVEAMIASAGGFLVPLEVTGPLLKKIPSYYGILAGDVTAVLETALSAGLSLVPENMRNPMKTTTRGLGETIVSALDRGCREIIIGLGGSATNDGGTGMAHALGVRFLDLQGREFMPVGGTLSRIGRIDLAGMDPRIKDTRFVAACDVDNPLTGQKGAAFVYAPQKGANPDQVELLDAGLRHFSDIVKQFCGISMDAIPGAGAAGGLGGALVAFCGAVLQSGIQIVMEASGFIEKLQGATLLITGEGRTDAQTARGKAPAGLSVIARSFGIPVLCLSGSLGEGHEDLYEKGADAVFCILSRPVGLKEAMASSKENLVMFSHALARLLLALEKRKNP